jgi:hypothetical protein
MRKRRVAYFTYASLSSKREVMAVGSCDDKKYQCFDQLRDDIITSKVS